MMTADTEIMYVDDKRLSHRSRNAGAHQLIKARSWKRQGPSEPPEENYFCKHLNLNLVNPILDF